MIKLQRGTEPSRLARVRDHQTSKLVPGQQPERTAALNASYRQFKQDLYEMQLRKCCYCEQRELEPCNDVEHYRPFSKYWWLAWHWHNLLFACRACNQLRKKDLFPLLSGSTPLTNGQAPPGAELPALLDPYADDPQLHIGFQPDALGRWGPVARSPRGQATIDIVGLAAEEYLDRYRDHVVDHVMPVIEHLRDALATRGQEAFAELLRVKWADLTRPRRAFSALNAAVLRHEFPGLLGERLSGAAASR